MSADDDDSKGKKFCLLGIMDNGDSVLKRGAEGRGPVKACAVAAKQTTIAVNFMVLVNQGATLVYQGQSSDGLGFHAI